MNAKNSYIQYYNHRIQLQEMRRQIDREIDSFYESMDSLVKTWFVTKHPELACKMIEHPKGGKNFKSWVPWSIVDPNTTFSLQYLVGIEIGSDGLEPDYPEYDIEDDLVWKEKTFHLSELDVEI